MNLAKPFCQPCGKEVQPSEDAAHREIRNYRRSIQNRQRKVPVAAYECPSGNGWHLTSRRVTRRDRKTA